MTMLSTHMMEMWEKHPMNGKTEDGFRWDEIEGHG
jgi:hypothetical protein